MWIYFILFFKTIYREASEKKPRICHYYFLKWSIEKLSEKRQEKSLLSLSFTLFVKRQERDPLLCYKNPSLVRVFYDKMGVGGTLKYLCHLMGRKKKKKKQQQQLQTVELKFRMDCDGCELKVKKALFSKSYIINMVYISPFSDFWVLK